MTDGVGGFPMESVDEIAKSKREAARSRHRRDVVKAIRDQRPRLLPEYGDCTGGWYGGLGILAIPVMEAFLWRALTVQDIDIGGHVDWSETTRQWMGHTHETGHAEFGNEPMSLVLALCHALNIVLPKEDR